MRCVDAVRAFFLSSSSFPSSSLSRLHDSKERRAKRRVVLLLSEIWNLCLQKSLVGVHSFCISHHECDHYSRKKNGGKSPPPPPPQYVDGKKWSLFSRKSRRLLVVNRRPLLNGKTKTPLLKEREREKSADSFSQAKKRVKKKRKNAFERRRIFSHFHSQIFTSFL